MNEITHKPSIIFQTKSRKFIDLSKIDAIGECRVHSVPGYGMGVYGFEVFLQFIEHPLIVFRGINHLLDKEVDEERNELVERWSEWINSANK